MYLKKAMSSENQGLESVTQNNFLEGTLAIDIKHLNQFLGPCFVNDYTDYNVSLIQINWVKCKWQDIRYL